MRCECKNGFWIVVLNGLLKFNTVDFHVTSPFAITTKFTLGSFPLKSFGLYMALAIIGFFVDVRVIRLLVFGQIVVNQVLVNGRVIGALIFGQWIGLAKDKVIGIMAIVGRLKQSR
jgi:hypothetical protein